MSFIKNSKLILVILFGFIAFSFIPIQDNKNNDRVSFLKQQIKQIEEILKTIKTDKSNFISQIQTRQGLINHRNELIDQMNKELETLSAQLIELQESNKNGLEKLSILKNDYVHVARRKYLFKLLNPDFSFFNLEEWNSIVHKIIWTDQLNKYRIKKFLLYKKSQENVLKKQEEIKIRITNQKDLLENQTKEKESLSLDFKKLQEDYQLIEVKQKDYLAIISKYVRERSALEKIINNSILEEDKNNTLLKSTSGNTSNWHFPLKGGTITSRFGTFRDKKNKQLTIKNNGIDIKSSDSFVSAIDESEALQIRQLPSGAFFLLTRIGQYYQVYSNLDKVLVRQGEKINRGDNIGELRMGSDGIYELHFEIWKGKTAVDPMSFLGR